MAKYAAKTKIGIAQSKSGLEKILIRYGATGYAYGWDRDVCVVTFRFNESMIRFMVKTPSSDDPEFTTSPSGRERSKQDRTKLWEQAQRQRWRAINLIVKAKLEAIDSGIVTFEEEFLAHTVLSNGSTVGEYTIPQLSKAIDRGSMPKLLPGCK